jgi:predicted ArsR family transcriptional regulator
MLHQVAKRLASPYEDRLRDKPLGERVEEAAAILEEQGCMTDWSPGEDGDYFIDEYTCPFPKIAEHDRSVCALHVEFVGILAGGDARLTRSLMRGERACTYRIRPASVRQEDVLAVAS